VASGSGKARAVQPGLKASAASPCAGCGAAGPDTCERLFELLLAKEYARDLPYGPLHGVTVACFFLQHPEHPKAPREIASLLDLLQEHVEHGSATLPKGVGLKRPSASWRPAVPMGGTMRATIAPPSADGRYGFTIADVAVDGTFPAAEHEKRVEIWARATLEAWPGSADSGAPG
jgi:hypothetical protein